MSQIFSNFAEYTSAPGVRAVLLEQPKPCEDAKYVISLPER